MYVNEIPPKLKIIFTEFLSKKNPKNAWTKRTKLFGHCECEGHTVHKLSQRRLTADLLAPRESVHGYAVRSLLTGCQVTSRPCDRFSRYSKWLDTFQAQDS
jgi:hypothetical protein